jgi:heat shock protein HtpX
VNFLEQQTSNRRRTWLVLALFVALLFALGYAFDYLYLGTGGTPVGALVALAVGVVSASAGYYNGDRAVLLSSGAIPLASSLAAAAGDEARLKLTRFDNVVEEMAIAAGLPKPKVYVIPDADPNAFATGRDPAHASVAVTTGLLDLVTREELQGVVAHELSHIRNLDIRLLTVIAALVGAVALLSDWTARGMWHGGARRAGGGRGRKNNGGLGIVLLLVWLVVAALAPLVAQVLAMAVSRRREYLADASGAELTRNPGALAEALSRIESAAAPTGAIKRGSAHLCIADPLGRRVGLREGSWSNLMATHPPMANRIAVLRQMAYQQFGAASRGTGPGRRP